MHIHIDPIEDRFDLLFDAVGKIKKDNVKKLLKENGKSLTVAGMDMVTEEKEDLELLSKMFENGNLKAVIDKTYPL